MPKFWSYPQPFVFQSIFLWYSNFMERNTDRQNGRARRVATSIKIEPEVAEYLQLLAEQLQRDRTFLINAIVSEHAQQNRGKLPPPLRIIPM